MQNLELVCAAVIISISY